MTMVPPAPAAGPPEVEGLAPLPPLQAVTASASGTASASVVRILGFVLNKGLLWVGIRADRTGSRRSGAKLRHWRLGRRHEHGPGRCVEVDIDLVGGCGEPVLRVMGVHPRACRLHG